VSLSLAVARPRTRGEDLCARAAAFAALVEDTLRELREHIGEPYGDDLDAGERAQLAADRDAYVRGGRARWSPIARQLGLDALSVGRRPTHALRPRVPRAARRTRTRSRGAGRPARRVPRGGDSGDSDGLADPPRARHGRASRGEAER
jgi:hypothetical protein